MPQRMGIEHTGPRSKVEYFECGGRRRQCNRQCGCANMCRTVAARHHRVAGEWGTTGQSEKEPQNVVDEANDDIEYDIVCIVEARCKAEIGNVPDVCNRGYGAPCMKEGAPSWTTWKGRPTSLLVACLYVCAKRRRRRRTSVTRKRVSCASDGGMDDI